MAYWGIYSEDRVEKQNKKPEIMREKIRYRENRSRRYNIQYERLDWMEEVVTEEIMEGGKMS